MAIYVQHNMAAANTNRMLGVATSSLSKNTEKLSSGYRINRAADDAAGLAISEKMRSQIRGLEQASTNAQDGISMIQTAEGALGESHSILQRMRELAVQAANGTETDDDRSNIQDEITQLQEELDRIAESTEFNTMKLLDGSLSAGGGTSASSGPKFGQYAANLQMFVTSSVVGVQIKKTTNATAGGESAIWDDTGKVLTLSLCENTTYTQSQIDELVKNAKQEDSANPLSQPADVTIKLNNGVFVSGSGAVTSSGTVAGARATASATTIAATGDYVGANGIELTSNKYGKDYNIQLTIKFDALQGEEKAECVTNATYTISGDLDSCGQYELKLQSGKEYTESDIERLLNKAGLDISVKFSGDAPDEPNTIFVTNSSTTKVLNFTGGTGLGDDDAFLGQSAYDAGGSSGNGITLQVGANDGQTLSFSIDAMDSTALGVNGTHVNVENQSKAQDSLNAIDEAIAKISKQRSALGAVQNRLEHTIANLDTSSENLQTAESRVRDVDMASEMVQYSKNNIIQQAGQSMLAQANQINQGVLSLLQG